LQGSIPETLRQGNRPAASALVFGTAKTRYACQKGQAPAGPESFLACARHINSDLTNWRGEHTLNTDQEYARYIREQKGKAGKI
jgi:hypothetical protein